MAQVPIHRPRRAERPHLQVGRCCRRNASAQRNDDAGRSADSVVLRCVVSCCASTRRSRPIKPDEPTMLFVTKCPCDECVPLIRGAGVTHIYTTDQDRDKDKVDISYLMFSSLRNVNKFTVSTANWWRCESSRSTQVQILCFCIYLIQRKCFSSTSLYKYVYILHWQNMLCYLILNDAGVEFNIKLDHILGGRLFTVLRLSVHFQHKKNQKRRK